MPSPITQLTLPYRTETPNGWFVQAWLISLDSVRFPGELSVEQTSTGNILVTVFVRYESEAEAAESILEEQYEKDLRMFATRGQNSKNRL